MKKLSFCLNGGNVLRYHTVAHTPRHQSVAEHSFRAYHIALYLTDCKASPAVLNAIMHHDVAEYITGDSPYTAKILSGELKRALDSIELDLHADYGIDMKLSREEYRLVKLCDMLEMGMYGAEMLRAGHRAYVPIVENVLRWMGENDDVVKKYAPHTLVIGTDVYEALER